MFSDIDKETSDRLAEAKWYLDNITEYHNSPQEIFKEKLYKGSFFVNLYGAIEYMVCSLVSRVIDNINEDQHVQVTHLKSSLLSLLLHNECEGSVFKFLIRNGKNDWTYSTVLRMKKKVAL